MLLGPKTIVINGRFITQPTTGVQRYAHEMLDALDSILAEHKNLDVILLTPSLTAPVKKFNHIRHLQVGLTQGHFWEQFELPFYVKSCILFCPGNTAPIFSLIFKKNVCVTVHDLSYLYFPEAYTSFFKLFYRTVIPLVFRFSKTVLTVSESEKSAILLRYPYLKKKIFAIQNGGPPFVFVPDFVLGEPVFVRPYVLYVGSLSKRKNFQNMLKVAHKLAEEHMLAFIFIGAVPGGIKNTEYRINGKFKDLILFKGQINNWQLLKKYYENAECFLFPSFYEASPLPPIEAMAFGCPVVASNIPSLVERCEDAAIYCDPYDSDDIYRSVVSILSNQSLRLKLVNKGLQRAKVFTWKECATKTLAAIIR